jgi:sigma-B regulation protein RsbU (phosphoserine phosphatase)
LDEHTGLEMMHAQRTASGQAEQDYVAEVSTAEGADGTRLTHASAQKMQALVVDDSPAVQLYLKTMLEKWGFETGTANDGAEAWLYMQKNSVQLLITDWMMPNMCGEELCRKIRAATLSNYIYIVLVTSRDNSNDLLRGMQAGADDFVTKPVNVAELCVRVDSAKRILALQGELEKRNRDLQQAYLAISQDLEAAALMQRSLLPEATRVNRLELQSMFQPATVVAGDIFGHFCLDHNRLAFYHIDVSGHGIASAMLSFTLSKIMTAAVGEGSPLRYLDAGIPARERFRSPSDVVSELNRRFQVEHETTLYFTMVFGIVDTVSGHVELCQAGHPSPVCIGRDATVQAIGTGGFPVGLLPQAEFTNTDVQLLPGDRLFIYSDGVSDCSNSGQSAFGTARLSEHLGACRSESLPGSLKSLGDRLQQWRGTSLFEDDLSVLAMEFCPQDSD